MDASSPLSSASIVASRPAGRSPWHAPAIVFVVALAVTGAMATYLLRALERRDAAAFAHEAQRTLQAMQERVDVTVTLLRGTAGLFVASDQVGNEEFTAYVRRLRLRELYPGIQGLGFTRRLQPDEVAVFEQEQWRAGRPGFHVWPDAPRDEFHSVVYLEPEDDRNRAAIGFDMSTHPVRRAAMDAARDSGEARASGKVTLVQEIDERKQAGFLIYMPIYEPRGTPPTVQARRRALYGFVYCPLRVDDLLRGTRAGGPIDYVLYDGEQPRPQAVLRDTRPDRQRAARFVTSQQLLVAGRPWRVQFFSGPSFNRLSDRRLIPLLVLVSVGSSLLLAGITALQVHARRSAEQLAVAAVHNARLFDELREATRRKDEFLAMLGHELRNPLAPVVTAVNALKRGLPPERAQRLYEVIERQSRQLTHLVNDLLEASRISTGRIVLQPTAMWMDAAVRSACEAVQPELHRRAQVLDTERRGTAAPLRADPTRLAQVIANLLHNASKFSPQGATIRLMVDEEPDHVLLQVVDRGRGIATDALPRLFELFEQAGERGPDLQGGLGIGLALVKRLVELHGGWVRADSEGPGRGAVFTVWLPREGPVPGADGT